MRCVNCGTENPKGTKFCGECGVSFQTLCPQCSFANLPSTKFCRQCGASLQEPPVGSASREQSVEYALPGAPHAVVPSAAEGERRQLTVMFCDLVGSTALSTQLDPEELREVIQAYRATCATVIRHFEGHLAKYIGDGLLVYFGYPLAHEDDAQRAVRTALGMIEAIPHLSFLTLQLSRPLQMRIGIHTGLVVAGEMGVGDQPEPLAIVGETPNIAARLQEHAQPNSVVISSSTYRLVHGLFECQDLGPQLLKGLATPLSVYRVVHESGARNRFEASMTLGLTPLIGRAPEIEFLQEPWEKAAQGAGQIVLLSGEPGIGKSRLVQQLTEQLGHKGVSRREFRCSPYHQNSALYPIIDHLQRLLQFARADSPAARLEKLRHMLSDSHFLQADMFPLLASLLSLPHPEEYPPITVSPQKQKEKTQAALVAWLVEEAKQKTVYIIWEDLHWADPSTLEVLNLVVDQAPTAPLYVLLTFRPEFSPPWGNRSHVSQLTLSRLGRAEVERMVEQVAGGKVLPREIVQQIVARTDGVPLFVEELTKTVLESVAAMGSGGSHDRPPLQTIAIPATLQDALMARLDRLGPAKEIAQMSATIGREFSYELLQAVSLINEGKLHRGLDQLVAAELVYQRGPVPQAHYLFKHALIQDTAYQSLLKSRRQQYHRQIAQILVERFAETVETQPELAAHHYTEAGLIEQAVPHWQKAGERASQRSAYVEAVAHLTKGLEVLKTLPDTSERARQELTLQATQGITLCVTKGFGAPAVGRAYTRARELCRQVGETPHLLPVLGGLAAFHYLRAELHTARELVEQVFRLAQSLQDPALLTWPHGMLGLVLYQLGELPSALTHLEQSIALYDPQKHRPNQVTAQDPKVTVLSYACLALWNLGYPNQARKRIAEALIQAQELSHPFSLSFALINAAALDQNLRDVKAVHERTEALLALAREQGFPLGLAWGAIRQGWMLAEQGSGKEGIAQMQQGLAAYRATGTVMGQSPILASLAAAYGKVGQVEEGLSVLAKALALVDKTGDRVSEAELYRRKGTLTLKQSGVRSSQPLTFNPQAETEAEACFLKAIEIAQRQQAKSLELRAVMSLARLWQQQGKTAEARKILTDIYGWFTEGFDTKDLQEAKALLEELT